MVNVVEVFRLTDGFTHKESSYSEAPKPLGEFFVYIHTTPTERKTVMLSHNYRRI